ncbi:MAG: hypothetical protein ABJN84_14940 [Flavobacteriaceae bacterium]
MKDKKKATFKSDKTIKLKPLYHLLILGIGQLYGAFVIFRLGVLTIKEDWINIVCFVASLGLMVWSGYLINAFFRYFSLKDNKIIFKRGNFLFLGIELEYSYIKDLEIKVYSSDLTLDIYLKQSEEPIPLSASYMKLRDFHEVYKTLVEIQSHSNREDFKPSIRR